MAKPPNVYRGNPPSFENRVRILVDKFDYTVEGAIRRIHEAAMAPRYNNESYDDETPEPP